MNSKIALNQILYGPPGTGKTFATVALAVEILDRSYFEANRDDRKSLKKRFDELTQSGTVKFVTFHQSFSYEDFIEGIRAEPNDDGQLKFEVTDGIFKNICDAATARVTSSSEPQANYDIAGRQIWKMSLGNTLGDDAYIYDECIEKGYVLLGYGGLRDFSSCQSRDEVFERFLADGKKVSKDDYAVTAVALFLLKLKKGDLIVVSEGNTKFRAIGEVTGDYRALNRDEQGDTYGQSRTVKWLRVYQPSLPFDQLLNNKFSQMTLYRFGADVVDLQKLAGLLSTAQAKSSQSSNLRHVFKVGERYGSGYEVIYVSDDIVELKKPNGNHLPIGMSLIKDLSSHVLNGDLTLKDIKEKKVFEKLPNTALEPNLVNSYENILVFLVERMVPFLKSSTTTSIDNTARVLIIDEINRGNISRIFGELITLIEPSKRAGEIEALEVTLPYSKTRFSVPSNVHLIGTMNTADRSLASLDIALRRRFRFIEMSPRPEVLKGINIEGVDVARLLICMNERVEALLDRDHRIGHAYFLPLASDQTFDNLSRIFSEQIMPLLQEYFFDDWTKIQIILNDHRKSAETCFVIRKEINVSNTTEENNSVFSRSERWEIQPDAFEKIESYLGIIDPALKIIDSAIQQEVNYNGVTIKRLNSKSIEVWKDGRRLSPAKPVLTQIADALSVDKHWDSGELINTREMGRRVIDAIAELSA